MEHYGELGEPDEPTPMEEMAGEFDWDSLPGPEELVPVMEEPERSGRPWSPQEKREAAPAVPVAGAYKCHHCGAELNPAHIPDAVLLSERGRRNAARRGQKGVWRIHSTVAAYCRCWSCQWKRLEAAVGRFHKLVATNPGGEPWWTDQRRSGLRERQRELLGKLPEGMREPDPLDI